MARLEEGPPPRKRRGVPIGTRSIASYFSRVIDIDDDDDIDASQPTPKKGPPAAVIVAEDELTIDEVAPLFLTSAQKRDRQRAQVEANFQKQVDADHEARRPFHSSQRTASKTIPSQEQRSSSYNQSLNMVWPTSSWTPFLEKSEPSSLGFGWTPFQTVSDALAAAVVMGGQPPSYLSLLSNNGDSHEAAYSAAVPSIHMHDVPDDSELGQGAQDLLGPALWTDILAPRTIQDVIGGEEACKLAEKWANAWCIRSGQGEARNLYGKGLYIGGTTGIGKTCLAYALAHDFGMEVLEIHASQLRSAKALGERAGEAAVSSVVGARSLLILLDDVDVVLGEDTGFYSAVIDLLRTTHYPVLLTGPPCPPAALVTLEASPWLVYTKMECADMNALRAFAYKIAQPWLQVAARHILFPQFCTDAQDRWLDSLIPQTGQPDIRALLNRLQIECRSWSFAFEARCLEEPVEVNPHPPATNLESELEYAVNMLQWSGLLELFRSKMDCEEKHLARLTAHAGSNGGGAWMQSALARSDSQTDVLRILQESYFRLQNIIITEWQIFPVDQSMFCAATAAANVNLRILAPKLKGSLSLAARMDALNLVASVSHEQKRNQSLNARRRFQYYFSGILPAILETTLAWTPLADADENTESAAGSEAEEESNVEDFLNDLKPISDSEIPDVSQFDISSGMTPKHMEAEIDIL